MKIACVLTDRANYGRLQPVLQAIQAAPELQLKVICGGSMVLDRFDEGGPPVQVVRADGFDVDAEVFHELEGGKHLTMAMSCGEGCKAYAQQLWTIDPDMLLCIGDRYETLGAATAAHLMNVPILHFQGGETSGCVDDRTRHAITMLSSWHVPATEKAAERVASMVGRGDTILAVGCPSSVIAAGIVCDDDEDGCPTGSLLCIMHPTTNEDIDERKQMDEVLEALKSVPHKVLLGWPNIDAHSDDIHRAIRTFTKKPKDWLTTFKNMPPLEFLQVLANSRCCVGNSSSFVRDSSHFGTPVVLIGNRQRGRECGENVIRVPCERAAIVEAIQKQLEHGRYEPSNLYGDGMVAQRTVEALVAMANKANESEIAWSAS